MPKTRKSCTTTPDDKSPSASETWSKETPPHSGIDPQELIDHLLHEIASGNLRYVSDERKRKQANS
jgi:hypothetical protein